MRLGVLGLGRPAKDDETEGDEEGAEEHRRKAVFGFGVELTFEVGVEESAAERDAGDHAEAWEGRCE